MREDILQGCSPPSTVCILINMGERERRNACVLGDCIPINMGERGEEKCIVLRDCCKKAIQRA